MLSKMISGAGGVGDSTTMEFVGGKTATAAGTQTPSYSITGLTGGSASDPASGDIVIVAVAFNSGTNGDITCTTAGYTEVTDLFENPINLAVFYKVLSAADTTVAFDLGVSIASRIAVHVWRNINATPLDATSVTDINKNGTENCPAITTVTNGAVVLAIAGVAGDGISALTVPLGMQNLFQSSSSTIALGIASRARSTAGTYNPPTFDGGGGDGDSVAAVTMALRPA